MTHLIYVVLVSSSALLRFVDVADIQYYATKYDHIDVDTILNNRRMVNYYADCLLSKGPCPPEGLEFKHILPEALQTNCVRCTEKQKTVTLRAFKRLKKEYPKIWNQLRELWDPDDIYVEKFESTFGSKQYGSVPQETVQIFNRFAGGNQNESGLDTTTQLFTSPLPLLVNVDNTTNSTSTTIRPPIVTKPTTNSISTKATTITTSTPRTTVSTKTPVIKSTIPKINLINTTTKPNINNKISTSSVKPTKRPRPNIGANIQATVSLGTNIVGDFVRGLGAIGNRVAETGVEIVGAVLKNIAKPL